METEEDGLLRVGGKKYQARLIAAKAKEETPYDRRH